MRFKQIFGSILLVGFISFMSYKFYYTIANQQDAGLIIALAITILLILLMAIRRVIRA